MFMLGKTNKKKKPHVSYEWRWRWRYNHIVIKIKDKTFKNGWSYTPTPLLRPHGVTGKTSRNLSAIQLIKIFLVSWTVRGVKN